MDFYTIVGLLSTVITFFGVSSPLRDNTIEQVKTLSSSVVCPFVPQSFLWCQKKTIDGPQVLQHPPRFGFTHYFAPPTIDNAFSTLSVENIFVLVDNTSSSYVAPDASYFCVGTEADPHFYQSRPKQLNRPSICDAARSRTPQSATTKDLSIVTSTGFAEEQRWYIFVLACVQAFAKFYWRDTLLLTLIAHSLASHLDLRRFPHLSPPLQQKVRNIQSSDSLRARLILKDAASKLILHNAHQKHQEELGRAQNELDQAQNALHQTQSDLGHAQSHLQQSQNELQQAKTELQETKPKQKDLQNKLDKAQNKLEKVQQSHDTKVNGLKKDHRLALDELTKFHNSDLQRKVKNLDQEHNLAVQELIKSHKQDLKRKEDDCNSTISSRISNIKSSHKRIQQDLESEVRDLKREHTTALEQVKESCQQDLQSIEDNYKSAISTCEQRCQDQISDIEATHKKECQKLESELAALKQAEKSRKQDADTNITLVNLKKEQAVAEAARLRSEKAKIESRNAANQLKLQEAHNRMTELQNEIELQQQKITETAVALKTDQATKVDASSQTDQVALRHEGGGDQHGSITDDGSISDEATATEDRDAVIERRKRMGKGRTTRTKRGEGWKRLKKYKWSSRPHLITHAFSTNEPKDLISTSGRWPPFLTQSAFDTTPFFPQPSNESASGHGTVADAVSGGQPEEVQTSGSANPDHEDSTATKHELTRNCNTSAAADSSSAEIDQPSIISSTSDHSQEEKKETNTAAQLSQEVHEQDTRDEQHVAVPSQSQDQPQSNGKDLMSLILSSTIGLEESRWAKASPSTSRQSTNRPSPRQNQVTNLKSANTKQDSAKTREALQPRAATQFNGGASLSQPPIQSSSIKNELLSSKWATNETGAAVQKSTPLLQDTSTSVNITRPSQAETQPSFGASCLTNPKEPANSTSASTAPSTGNGNITGSKPPVSRSLGASRWATTPLNPSTDTSSKPFRGEAPQFTPSSSVQQGSVPDTQHQQPPTAPQPAKQAAVSSIPTEPRNSAPANAPQAPRALLRQQQQQQQRQYQQLHLPLPSQPKPQQPPSPPLATVPKPQPQIRHSDGWTGGAGPHAHESPLGEAGRNPTTKLRNALKRAAGDRQKRNVAIREWEERTGRDYWGEKMAGRHP